MKFKNILPFLAFMAFVSSCSVKQEETEAPQIPIAYDTGQTRFSDGCRFDVGDKISVWANYRESETTTPYIEGQLVTLSQDNVWIPDAVSYWPLENQMDFYAIYPAPGSNAYEVNKLNVKAGEKPSVEYDIIDIRKSQDVIVACTEGMQCSKHETVPLHFKHALSKLQFKIKNECEYGGGMRIKIESLAVTCKLYDTGTLDWEFMSLVPTGPLKEHQFETYNIDFEPYQEREFGNYFCIPQDDVIDIEVSATWSIYNGDKVAETFKVKKTFEDEIFPLRAGSLTCIRLVLKRMSGGEYGDIII